MTILPIERGVNTAVYFAGCYENCIPEPVQIQTWPWSDGKGIPRDRWTIRLLL